jgi:transposase
MMGPRRRREAKLFYTGIDLETRVPRDHRLRRIAQAVSFDVVRSRVAPLYGHNGHASLDPVVTLKLMLLLFLENVASERELMRQLPLRLDWLWFLEMDLDDPAPHHSVLSKARRRWGVAVFEALFTDVLLQCRDAGLIDGQTVYADSTVLKADASVDSRVPRRLWEQLERAAEPPSEPPPAPPREDDDAGSGEAEGSNDRACQHAAPPPSPEPSEASAPEAPPQEAKFNRRWVSTTDPDAATTQRRGRGVTLGYRDHRLVDRRRGVVLATLATPADTDDAAMLTPLLDEQLRRLHQTPRCAVGDSAYGTKDNVAALRRRGVRPYLKPRPGRRGLGGWLRRMPAGCGPETTRRLMGERLSIAEGSFAHAHTRMGHRRCRWRRLWRVQTQCLLVSMSQNIQKLARHGRRLRATAEAAMTAPAATASLTIAAISTLSRRGRSALHPHQGPCAPSQL